MTNPVFPPRLNFLSRNFHQLQLINRQVQQLPYHLLYFYTDLEVPSKLVETFPSRKLKSHAWRKKEKKEKKEKRSHVRNVLRRSVSDAYRKSRISLHRKFHFYRACPSISRLTKAHVRRPTEDFRAWRSPAVHANRNETNSGKILPAKLQFVTPLRPLTHVISMQFRWNVAIYRGCTLIMLGDAILRRSTSRFLSGLDSWARDANARDGKVRASYQSRTIDQYLATIVASPRIYRSIDSIQSIQRDPRGSNEAKREITRRVE